MRLAPVAAVVALALIGCGRKPAASVSPTSAASPNAGFVAAAEALRTKQPRVKDAAVYVDGTIVGFLKFNELPPELKPLDGRPGQVEFGFASYVKALGLDLAKVRSLQMHGGRVAIVPGDALRANGDAIRFIYRTDGSGTVRPRFVGGSQSVKGLNTTIDMISALAIYVEKEPPVENADFGLSYPDGRAIVGVMPYADEESGAGTRVYLDGKLVSIVKRRSLTNDLLASDDLSKPVFSAGAYLARAGIDLGGVQAAQTITVAGDVLDVDLGALGAGTFVLPSGNQGLASFQLAGRSDKTAAIRLYRTKTLPRRAEASVAAAVKQG